MLALVNVLSAPAISADTAKRLTSPVRLGEIWDRTPIWIPNDPILAKPQSA
jgi:predicted transcriptional regulator